MAYSTTGLKAIARYGDQQVWELKTVDSLATAVGSNYVSDATSVGTRGAAGRGMKTGDIVWIYSGVDSITAMTSFTKLTPAGAVVNSTTGAATLTAVALS